mgnify:CR=1 FL=1
MNTLPPELLAHIISLGATSSSVLREWYPNPARAGIKSIALPNAREFLLACLFVCKQWSCFALAELVREVQVFRPGQTQKVTKLLKKQGWECRVQTMWGAGSTRSEREFGKLLGLCPLVRRLCWCSSWTASRRKPAPLRFLAHAGSKC